MAKHQSRLSRKQREAQTSHTTTVQESVDDLSKSGVNAPVSFVRALESSQEAHQDLRLVAALAGVDFVKLLLCLVQQVGWAGLVKCLRSGQGIFSCLGDNVNLEGALACAGGAAGNPPGFTAVEKKEDTPTSAGEF